MPKTPDDLIKEYKDLYNRLSAPSDMERSACTLYVSIFERLKRKMRLDRLKVVNFIRTDFYVQDKKRLQFGEDEQHDDAYLCAQVQQAYRIFWVQVLELPLNANLCARKVKAEFYPVAPQSSPLGISGYAAAKTGRT